MATILRDADLRQLLGGVIQNGDPTCIRPNSSQRKGAPIGMRDNEWEDSVIEGGPEELLENLIKSGYPWHVLGERLKIIDQQFKSVTNEYAEIQDSIEKLTGGVNEIRKQSQGISESVKSAVREEATHLQNRWLIGLGSMAVAALGLGMSVKSNPLISNFIDEQGAWLGITLVLIGIVTLVVISKRGK